MRAADDGALGEEEARALFAGLEQANSIVLAVSGGPDSTALMALVARWRAKLAHAPKILAVTVDHGLRKTSRAEARAVKRLAQRLAIAHATRLWRGIKPVTGLQEAARNARYRLLIEAARKARAQYVLTAHTLDDQAETVLFRLSRGSGIAGLSGMARETALRDVVLLRPFLGVPKARLMATLKAAGIDYVSDPSNLDPRFARPRWRKLMPLLAAEGLDARRLALFAARIARINAAIEASTEQAWRRVKLQHAAHAGAASVAFRSSEFAELPAEIALRLLGRAIERMGDEGPVELGKLERLHQMLAEALAQSPAARFRRTLAGALVSLAPGHIEVSRAPARRSRQRSAVKTAAREHENPFTKPRL